MRNTPFATRSSSEVLDGEGLEGENGRFENGRDGAGNWWSSSFLWSSTAVTNLLAQVPGPPPRPQCVLGRTSRGPRAIQAGGQPRECLAGSYSTALHCTALLSELTGQGEGRGFFPKGSTVEWR